jgi:hypothetical protein
MPKPFVYYDMLYTYQHFALQLYDLFIYLFASDWFSDLEGSWFLMGI